AANIRDLPIKLKFITAVNSTALNLFGYCELLINKKLQVIRRLVTDDEPGAARAGRPLCSLGLPFLFLNRLFRNLELSDAVMKSLRGGLTATPGRRRRPDKMWI
ncbi:MAG TPA: hypothetical protein DEP76_02065, partial [Alteromonas sp.]|nr:hypothetical protein [Alteromonas sp.]